MMLRYGVKVREPLDLVALSWWSKPFKTEREIKDALRDCADAGKSGVYVFEGCHDAHPHPCVLYIGKTGGDGGGRTLGERIPESAQQVYVVGAGDDGPFADVWDLTLRWAAVESTLVDAVEALLIVAHAPPFCSQGVRKNDIPEDAERLVLLNGGEKGRILPAVVGTYFVSKIWPKQ